MALIEDIVVHAHDLGFEHVGIVPIGRPAHGAAFAEWLAAGHAGEMTYLAARAAERLDPASWLAGQNSLIMLAVNHFPGAPPPSWRDPAYGRFARYAWAPDYHDLLKARLFALDAFIRARTGRTAFGKACVDSAPLLERDFAAQAGLGFIGRNTCVIARGLGSWTFLAALAVPERLPITPAPITSSTTTFSCTPFGQPWPMDDRRAPADPCGRCTRCLDACPARAFVAPRVLDARRCISYLTIELRGPIPAELRPRMGNWVFGCDVCQEVCPYNRAAAPARREFWPADPARATVSLLELLALDEVGFRRRFHGTAIRRAKRRGLVRNACVAAGNWGDEAALPALIALLADEEPLIRGHAAWALGRISGPAAQQALSGRAAVEADPWVAAEIAAALSAHMQGIHPAK